MLFFLRMAVIHMIIYVNHAGYLDFSDWTVEVKTRETSS